MQRGKLLANVLYKVIRTELNLAQILGQSLPAPNAFTSIIYSRNDIHWTICYLYLEHSQKKTAQESTRAYRLVSDTFGEWLLSCIVQVTPVSREWIASFILTLGLWQRDGGIGGKDRRKDKKDENWFYRNQE